MKNAILLFAMGAAALLAQPAGTARSVPDSYKDIQYPPLRGIQVPPSERYVLPNGMVVYLIEDHELPLVHARAVIRTGSRLVQPARSGLASMTFRVMRTGGSTTRSGDELDKELDRLAMSVESSAADDSASAGMFVLRKDVEKGFAVLADVLRNPAFPQDKIDLAKMNLRDGIGRRNDDPMDIQSREFARLLYGKDSPYGHQPEYATLDTITRDDLVAFHKRFVQPENIILGVWGDFKKAEMKALIEKALGSWPRGGNPAPPVPAVDPAASAKGLHLISKPDVNQSNISVGFLLGRRDDPDYAALVVMTQVLGGGFGSRLTNEIRSRMGLAYMAGAGYNAQYDYPGAWVARVGTKSQSTLLALEAVYRELRKMTESEPTAEELRKAKDSLLKGEAFDFDSTSKIVARMLTYEYFGYPQDYLDKYRAAVQKVSAADVLRVAKKHLLPERFLTLVLGKPDDFDKPLSTLGAVSSVDISIPPPKQEAPAAATPETAEKGKALMARLRAAHGGAALDGIRDYQVKGTVTAVTAQGEMPLQMEATVNMAGKNLVKLGTPMGEMVQAFDGTVAWTKSPRGVEEAPAEEARKSILRDTLSLLRNYGQPGYQVQALGASELDGRKVEGVAVSLPSAGLQVKLFVDAASGVLAGRGFTGSLFGPPADLLEVYSDYREVEGVKLPFASVTTRQGQKAATMQLTELKLNPGVEDTAYRKP